MTEFVAASSWEIRGRPAAEDDLASWSARSLADAGLTADALYVATATAGARESIAFWRAALDTGLAFANPRLFPWTLANSPTGAIAKALGIRGPTYTLLGDDDAVAAALSHAERDLAAGLATSALVVALDADDDWMQMTAILIRRTEAASAGRPAVPGAEETVSRTRRTNARGPDSLVAQAPPSRSDTRLM